MTPALRPSGSADRVARLLSLIAMLVSLLSLRAVRAPGRPIAQATMRTAAHLTREEAEAQGQWTLQRPDAESLSVVNVGDRPVYDVSLVISSPAHKVEYVLLPTIDEVPPGSSIP